MSCSFIFVKNAILCVEVSLQYILILLVEKQCRGQALSHCVIVT